MSTNQNSEQVICSAWVIQMYILKAHSTRVNMLLPTLFFFIQVFFFIFFFAICANMLQLNRASLLSAASFVEWAEMLERAAECNIAMLLWVTGWAALFWTIYVWTIYVQGHLLWYHTTSQVCTAERQLSLWRVYVCVCVVLTVSLSFFWFYLNNILICFVL